MAAPIKECDIDKAQRLVDRNVFNCIIIDVFKTVITPIPFGDHHSLLLLGSRLFESCISPLQPQDFVRRRQTAERNVRSALSREKKGEIDLAAVYSEFVRLDPEIATHPREFEEAEIALQDEISRPLPGMAELLNSFRQRHRKIVFIANSLLPVSAVRNLLFRQGLADCKDPVYVFGEDDFSARRDFLRGVLAAQAIDPAEACYIGSALCSDFACAVQAGVKSVPLEPAHYSHYEVSMAAGPSLEGSWIGSAMAAASRLARVSELESGGGNPVLAEVAAGVAGPLLYGFVAWLLEEAERWGIGRLYFLSREGALPAAVAEAIATEKDLRISIHYIYVSRRSLNIALLSDCNPPNLEWALTHSNLDSLRVLLQRIGLEPGDLAIELEDLKLGEERWDSVLNKEEREEISALLLSERVRRIIEIRAAERRALIEEYLGLYDFFEDGGVGVIDTTGVGSQMYTLNKLRESVCGKQIRGFLCVRDRKNSANPYDFPPIDTFLYDLNRDDVTSFSGGIRQMLEVFCMAACGSCVGYTRNHAGEVMPVLAEFSADSLHVEVSSVVKAVVVRFAMELARIAVPQDFRTDVRAIALANFDVFWESPTREEATTWGAYRFQLGSAGSESYKPLARPLGLIDIFIIWKGREHQTYDWYFWRSGSEHLSSRAIRGLFLLVRAAKRWLEVRKTSVGAKRWLPK